MAASVCIYELICFYQQVRRYAFEKYQRYDTEFFYDAEATICVKETTHYTQ